jgi:periplasmic protein TonB
VFTGLKGQHMSMRIVMAIAVAAALLASCSSKPVPPDGTRAPVVIKRVDPDYPVQYREARIEGWVQVSGTVPKEGGVLRDPRVVNSNDKRLEPLALAAVSRWEWKPAMKDGQPVDVIFVTTVRFSLNR